MPNEHPPCDKCGQPVPPENDATIIADIKDGQIMILLPEARHFLPVPGCEGSPSRAQYLPNQPRDKRYPYDETQEQAWRDAYAEAQRRYGQRR